MLLFTLRLGRISRETAQHSTDLYPGNVTLPASSIEEVQFLLHQPLIEHKVEREDGAPTPKCLPTSVTKPVDLGFGDGTRKTIDFRFSFDYKEGAIVESDQLSRGAAKPIEFETSESTTEPFKVDSW